MRFEWDAKKAAFNFKKHKVAFNDAATVFLDPLAITFEDPDHSLDERREITIGCTLNGQVVFVSHREVAGCFRIISVMKKTPKTKRVDDLRHEYNLENLRSGVRGKYHPQATAGTNLILIDPDLAKLFPDSDSVNRALRLLAEAARLATNSKSERSPN